MRIHRYNQPQKTNSRLILVLGRGTRLVSKIRSPSLPPAPAELFRLNASIGSFSCPFEPGVTSLLAQRGLRRLSGCKFELNAFEIVVETKRTPDNPRRRVYAPIHAWRTPATGPKATEMKPALLIMVFVASASPGLAADKRDLGQDRWNESSHVNCETVRAYVAQVGLVQATALARAAGMTPGQEWRARRCLAKKV